MIRILVQYVMTVPSGVFGLRSAGHFVLRFDVDRSALRVADALANSPKASPYTSSDSRFRLAQILVLSGC